jgi:preprotein translocase subunit YajC
MKKVLDFILIFLLIFFIFNFFTSKDDNKQVIESVVFKTTSSSYAVPA